MRLSASTCFIETALAEVSNFEARIKKIPLSHHASVQISPSHSQISISTAGEVFLGSLNPQLIHQLGSKIWRNRDRVATAQLWNEHINSDLTHLLEGALSKSGSVLRYYDSGNVRHIYGLTSPHFVEVNQSVFRGVLVETLDRLGIAPKEEVSKTPFGEVVEEFSVPLQGGEVGLSCRVVYGLNNGYSSYRLNWGRTVLICKNGLTTFENKRQDRWIHDGCVDIGHFATVAVESAFNHLSIVEKQILDARERAINYSLLDQFMTRLAIANASKERVSARLSHEFSDTGPNEWSVSQALTFLGQHEKAIPFRVRDDLTRLGSTLLEQPLAQLVASPAVITSAGFYDILR